MHGLMFIHYCTTRNMYTQEMPHAAPFGMRVTNRAMVSHIVRGVKSKSVNQRWCLWSEYVIMQILAFTDIGNNDAYAYLF